MSDIGVHAGSSNRQGPGDESEIISTLARIRAVLTSDLDLQKIVQTVTDDTTQLAGTEFGAEVIRSADITEDPRYGKNAPYYGEPAGHLPVMSGDVRVSSALGNVSSFTLSLPMTRPAQATVD